MNKSCCLKWSPILTLIIVAGLIGCTPPSRPTTVASTQSVESPETAQTSETTEQSGPVTISQSATSPQSRFEIEDQPAVNKTPKIRMKQNHPKKYTVKKGDTLWDISSIFLKDAWYWPEIWQKNPQLQNPHLIYPGDVLTLIMVNGQPKIVINESPMRQLKASPKIRRSALKATIPVIPGDAIRQFVIKPRVVSKKELDDSPYILGSDDEHLVLSKGNRVYIRGELDKERVRYTVFRPNKELHDPESGKLLGYEAVYAGEVHIEKYGDPAVGTLTFTEREVLIGDRLLPIDKSAIQNIYQPHFPENDIDARVVSLFDALFGVAKYQVVVINQGSRDGIEVGHILASYTKGQSVRDKYNLAGETSNVQLPDETSGLMMVFRTFDQVSYALVMQSTNVIHHGDTVRTPD
jgi:LysM repeat protein